jgi:CMP-N,N'-diacetyllegionaminic acid synthase
MFKKEKYLALIVARKGSKGLKNKNIIKIQSKPCIEWTFIEAKKSKLIDKILLSTDSKKIMNIAKTYEILIPFVRPDYLAKDNTSVLRVIKHALRWVQQNIYEKYDNIILLQPTSPLRKAKHIDEAIIHFSKNKKSSKTKLVSVTNINGKHNWIMRKNKLYCNFISNCLNLKDLRRQKNNQLVLPNGSIFISSIKDIKSGFYNDYTLFYLMKKEDSIDIDSKTDFKLANALIKKSKYANIKVKL